MEFACVAVCSQTLILTPYLHNKQWWIQDFKKGGGNDIAEVDPKILRGGGNMRHAFVIAYFSLLLCLLLTFGYFSTT